MPSATNTVTNTVHLGRVEVDVPSALLRARIDHTATLLSNGKILVTGGTGENGATTAELYDPATGISTATGDMLAQRGDHTATLLPNGKVLIVGGLYYTRTPSYAELYDPATGQFEATANMQQYRSEATATLLQNGKVLIAGGYDPITRRHFNTAELYDPATGTFTLTGSMSVARREHSATLLNDGTVLAVGGFSAGSIWDAQLSSAELYDPATGTWKPTGSLARVRFDHTATLLQNGHVMIYGGQEQLSNAEDPYVEVYDPAAKTFHVAGTFSEPRPSPTVTLLPSGNVLITGGIFSADFNPVSDIVAFEPTTGGQQDFGYLIQNRTRHTATLLPDGQIVLLGGTERREIEHIVYSTANAYTGSLQTPTGWITSTTTISFTGSTSNAPLNAGAINTGNWIAATNNQTVPTRYFPLTQGRDIPVSLRLRDTQGMSASVVIGHVDVDSIAPASLMATLVPISQPEIKLNWSASDATSGVLDYDVEVRDGKNGAWTRLLSATTERSTTFTGEHGHHYYFRVRGRDVAGNVEAWPADFDAETNVLPFMPPENRVTLPMIRR